MFYIPRVIPVCLTFYGVTRCSDVITTCSIILCKHVVSLVCNAHIHNHVVCSMCTALTIYVYAMLYTLNTRVLLFWEQIRMMHII